ncbi:MAG: ribosome recycling factor [Endomicrobium sp.]|jgi:ribosome recycling factor|nr:ribosome recycling factor [Endomicrobium sp.]
MDYNKVEFNDFLKKTEVSMQNIINVFTVELSHLKTNKADSSLVSNIKVCVYGSFLEINKIASVSILNSKTIEINPWDVKQLNNIEKAIFEANIGLTPINDGKAIRILIPFFSEEKRKETVKFMLKISENFKISIRNERKKVIEQLKKIEKNKIISEDEKKRFEIDIKKLVDKYVKRINDISICKEKEIMSI